MTALSEEEELLKRAERVAAGPYPKEKEAILRYFADIPVGFTVPDLLMDYLREKTDLRERDAAALVLELHAEGLIYSATLENSGIGIIRLTKLGQERLDSIE